MTVNTVETVLDNVTRLGVNNPRLSGIELRNTLAGKTIVGDVCNEHVGERVEVTLGSGVLNLNTGTVLVELLDSIERNPRPGEDNVVGSRCRCRDGEVVDPGRESLRSKCLLLVLEVTVDGGTSSHNRLDDLEGLSVVVGQGELARSTSVVTLSGLGSVGRVNNPVYVSDHALLS